MRAVVCDRLGEATDAAVLRLDQHAAPHLLKGHVRIRVVAASINFPDYLQIKVRYGAVAVGSTACPDRYSCLKGPRRPALDAPPAAHHHNAAADHARDLAADAAPAPAVPW